MKLFDTTAKSIIENMVIATLPKITVKSGVCRYNFRCQMNAVHDALNDDQDKIAMCFYMNNSNYPTIHFLNIDSDGNYIDNTLGRWSETYDYYLVRIIEKESFFTINDIFTAYRKELRRQLPFYIRWFNDCEF
jgi:hypothetical protein